jgi:carboxylesterase
MIAAVLLLLVVAAAAGIALNERRSAGRLEAEYASRYPEGADGVVAGAEGFTLEGTIGRRLLMLHGSGDSPQSLRYLADRLNAAGYEVHVPLLPGHGRSPRAFSTATASDYHLAAFGALLELTASEGWIAVVGLSMGGALAARLCAESARVQALVLLAPYFTPPSGVRVAHALSWLWSPVMPYVRGGGEESVHDPVAREASRAYGSFSAGALSALVDTAAAGRRAIPSLHLPTLIINSERDNRIPHGLAQNAVNTFTVPVEAHWLEGCGHVITVDYCKGTVADLVLAFLARHAG